MIKLLFSTLTLLIISGCATSDLSYKNEKINLRINNTSLQVHGITIKEKHNNFSTLFLTQKLLRLDDGNIVVYEEAKTDTLYQFDPTTQRSIDIIFDAKHIIKIYYNTFIYAFQIVLKDNRVLNVLVAQGYDQELQMVYGMSTKKLNDILKKLDKNLKPIYHKDVIDLSKEPTPFISKWTTRKVHFSPLIVPLNRLGRL